MNLGVDDGTSHLVITNFPSLVRLRRYSSPLFSIQTSLPHVESVSKLMILGSRGSLSSGGTGGTGGSIFIVTALQGLVNTREFNSLGREQARVRCDYDIRLRVVAG